MLILAQRPDATRVAGYRKWQELGRQVQKGEKAITILAPIVKKVEDDAGAEERKVVGFRAASVFDISQTQGDPLPEVNVPILEGDEGGCLYDDLGHVAAADGVRVDRSARFNPLSAMGVYYPDSKRIIVREAPQLQMTKTLAHELGHHFTGLHETYGEHRAEHETIAESVAYVVLARYGLDSGERSFP